MTARLNVGDRVRGMLDHEEGVVERVDTAGRIPSVVVRLVHGAVIETSMGEWERLPEVGSLAAT